jgi:hypothetical protein
MNRREPSFEPVEELRELGLVPCVTVALRCRCAERRVKVKKVTILQLGDVHYPESKRDSGADNDGFTPDQVGTITGPRLKSVLERVVSLSKLGALTVLSGDLTDRGNIEGYRQAVQFLSGPLGIADSPANFVAVPGNHDINKFDIQIDETDHFAKFLPITKIWDEEVAAGVFQPDRVRTVTATAESISVPVIALNTCVLCWEYRSIPEDWKVSARQILTPEVDPEKLEEILEGIGRLQVDSPSVHDDHLTELERIVGDTIPACVVVGHHALLPQARPRLEINGEPVNAGKLRYALLRVPTPVIYLHGHLHDDPIECLSNEPEGHFLLTIGAPHLQDGFNEIELHLSSEGTFLGVEVIEHRFTGTRLEAKQRRQVKFPVISNERRDLLKELSRLVAVGETASVQDLRVQIGRRDDIHPRVDLSDESVESLLREADWLGLLSIDTKGDGPLAKWRIAS